MNKLEENSPTVYNHDNRPLLIISKLSSLLIISKLSQFSSSFALWVLEVSAACSEIVSRSWYIVVDGCRSNLVNVVSLTASEQCFGLAVFSPTHLREFLSVLENKVYGYVDNSTLVAVMPSPLDRVAIAKSLNP